MSARRSMKYAREMPALINMRKTTIKHGNNWLLFFAGGKYVRRENERGRELIGEPRVSNPSERRRRRSGLERGRHVRPFITHSLRIVSRDNHAYNSLALELHRDNAFVRPDSLSKALTATRRWYTWFKPAPRDTGHSSNVPPGANDPAFNRAAANEIRDYPSRVFELPACSTKNRELNLI